jgi:hypothetical protein
VGALGDAGAPGFVATCAALAELCGARRKARRDAVAAGALRAVVEAFEQPRWALFTIQNFYLVTISYYKYMREGGACVYSRKWLLCNRFP